MNRIKNLVIAGVCAVSLSACSTQIISTATTLPPSETTTTTLAPPEGDIVELLDQLDELTQNLGQEIVDGERAVFTAKYERAQQILVAVEPQIRASGIDMVDDVERIVGLIGTATIRKRPADADKAQRFLTLIRESLPELLANQ
ncbi:unannotated protein [freshwater metagenome]|uniref:Unannotated protein n=1 Tax=freshwater metagenome TaxID=449393 RepID=A0A6J6K839_9ZZZZ